MLTILDKKTIFQRFAITETQEPAYVTDAIENICDVLVASGGKPIHPTRRGKVNQAIQSLMNGGISSVDVYSIIQLRHSEISERVSAIDDQGVECHEQLEELEAKKAELEGSYQVAVVSLDHIESERLLTEVNVIEKEISNVTLKLKTSGLGLSELKKTLDAYGFACDAMKKHFDSERFTQFHNEFIEAHAGGFCALLDEYQAELDQLGFTLHGSEYLSKAGIEVMKKMLSKQVA